MTSPASARNSDRRRRRKALIAAHPDIDVVELKDLLSGDKAPSREDARTLLLVTVIAALKSRHSWMGAKRLAALVTQDVDTVLARMESNGMDFTTFDDTHRAKLTVEITDWIDQALGQMSIRS